MLEAATVRVKRDGGRGHHLISKEKYDASPGDYELVGKDGGSSSNGNGNGDGGGDANTGPTAIHLGQGHWAVVDGEGNKLLEGLKKAQAVEFNKMDADEKATFIAITENTKALD